MISLSKPARKIDELHITEMPESVPNESVLKEALAPLLKGNDMGILSEAGLPAIADPGSGYVAAAHRMGIEVIPMSGPSSLFMALMASGMDGQRFMFHGYLSAKKDELGKQLRELEQRSNRDRATQIWIETPYRNMQVMEAVEHQLHAKTRFCIAANMGGESGFVKTKTVGDWKKMGWPEVHKVPVVFLLEARE